MSIVVTLERILVASMFVSDRQRMYRQRMCGVRPPAVAGMFYPDDPTTLRRTVDQMLQEAMATPPQDLPAENLPPKAIIAPHAGYPYSGPIAGSAFAPLSPLAGRVERVVLVGPSHHVAFNGLALPDADSFETPLGQIEIDLEAAASLLELSDVHIAGAPHRREHALEVELPFLQRILGPFRLLPLVAGSLAPPRMARALARVWGGDETRIIVSSDLSHFLDYAAARQSDRRTAAAIVKLATDLQPQQACGATAINGLLHLAAGPTPLAVRVLDLRNSGDTAGDQRRVVGYGAFSLTGDKGN